MTILQTLLGAPFHTLLSARTRRRPAARLIVAASLVLAGAGSQALAASTEGCEGGGFLVLGVRAPQDRVVAANALGSGGLIEVRGKYVHFDVDTASFGIRNYVLTGAANKRDLTGGRRTPVFASKMPDHRGLVLTGPVELSLVGEAIELIREGPGLKMKIQAKDCATGGVFQMEPERVDEKATLFTHVLAPSAFYFDNGNFRQREGDRVPYKDTTIIVPSRVNFANDVSRKFVGRDSAQVAERLDDPRCGNRILRRGGDFATVNHCGQVSHWMVASGGRMGQVMGEDSVEVAPPATECTHQCRGRNRVRGAAVVLGFPVPVPIGQRLIPPSP